MKIYPLNNKSRDGRKEFRANENTYSVTLFYLAGGAAPEYQHKTIMFEERELLLLYQAIQDEILNKKEK